MLCIRNSIFVAALVLTAVGADRASAQRTSPPGAAQVTPSSPYTTPLYRNPDVARNLDLTRDQIDRLNQATDRLQGRYRDQFDRVNRLDERARDARRQELLRNYSGDWTRSAGDIFNERQMSRYRQLELQSRGLDAFRDPDVRRRLNLTDEQYRKLSDLGTRVDEERQNIPATERLQTRDTLRNWRDFMGRTQRSMNDILTDEQRRAWREMTGDPFDFPPPGLRGPTPPPGGTSR